MREQRTDVAADHALPSETQTVAVVKFYDNQKELALKLCLHFLANFLTLYAQEAVSSTCGATGELFAR